MQSLAELGVAARRGTTLGFVLGALLLLPAARAAATPIEASLVDLGGGRYRAVYTIVNDGTLGGDVAGFDIFFDPALYEEASLSIVTPASLASAWDELLLGSGVLVPAAYDAVALAGGVPSGSVATGFAVEFVWLGSGLPGPQPFEIFDPETFQVLESGVTVLVPEATSLALIGLGIAAVSAARRRTRHAR